MGPLTRAVVIASSSGLLSGVTVSWSVAWLHAVVTSRLPSCISKAGAGTACCRNPLRLLIYNHKPTMTDAIEDQ